MFNSVAFIINTKIDVAFQTQFIVEIPKGEVVPEKGIGSWVRTDVSSDR